MTGFRGGAAGPLAAILLAAALAGCAQQTAQHRSAANDAYYNRPTSYEPPGPSHDPWGPWVRDAARRFDIPERWIREVMRQESGGRVTATSGAGAMGLLQLMPGTYAEMQRRYGLGDDPYHPYDNIQAGTAYMREMYDLYGSPAFLAAYNAGPRRLEDYLWGSRGLPNETRNYVARIGPRIAGTHPSRRAPPEVYAAAEMPTNIPAGPRRMDSATMLALREQRRGAEQVAIASAAPAPAAVAPIAAARAGTVIAMDPIPDGSTYGTPPAPAPERVQLASLGGVVRMEPIPDGSTPEGAAAMAAASSRQALAEAAAQSAAERAAQQEDERPTPPPPARRGFGTMGTAYAATALPVPASPRGAPPQRARDTRHEPAPPPAQMAQRGGRGMTLAYAEPPRMAPSAAPARGFGFMGTAHAGTLPSPPPTRGAAPAASGGAARWSVQVGAFSSENLARNAAGQARDAIAAMGARTVIQPVQQGRNTLYRARVTGLTRDAAEQACRRTRGACAVISPDA